APAADPSGTRPGRSAGGAGRRPADRARFGPSPPGRMVGSPVQFARRRRAWSTSRTIESVPGSDGKPIPKPSRAGSRADSAPDGTAIGDGEGAAGARRPGTVMTALAEDVAGL